MLRPTCCMLRCKAVRRCHFAVFKNSSVAANSSVPPCSAVQGVTTLSGSTHSVPTAISKKISQMTLMIAPATTALQRASHQ